METRIVSFIEATSSGPLQNPEDLVIGSINNHDEDFVEQAMPELFKKTKRRSLPRPIRDSLATRERQRMGKPGSRRHNRFINNIFLGADGMDSELELEELEDLFWQPEYRSHFAELFDSEEKMAAWLPFLDIDDSDEGLLLSLVCGEDSDEEAEDMPLSAEEERLLHAEQNFLSIDRDTRKLLKKAFNFGLIQSIEAELLTGFMNIDASFMRNESYEYFELVPSSPAPKKKSKKGKKGRKEKQSSFEAQDRTTVSLAFKNSKDRKVCHGVCKYYSLFSSSESASSGRITTITSPKAYQYASAPPPLLSEYLWDNYFRA